MSVWPLLIGGLASAIVGIYHAVDGRFDRATFYMVFAVFLMMDLHP